MTLPSTDFHPHPERTDSDFEKLHSAYHDALEMIGHRDTDISQLRAQRNEMFVKNSELRRENASLRALTIRQANQLSSYEDETSRLHQLLTSYQQQVSRLAEHIDADHAYLRQTLGNGGVVSAHNPNLPPDIRTMFAGEAAAARKKIAADDGPEALYEHEAFGGRRHDLELFNSIPALAAVGPRTIDSV